MSCIICPRTNKYCLDPDCGLTTGICNPSKVAILKESTPSTEQESQEELWNEAQNFVKNHLGTYSNDLVCDLARWAIEEMKKHYIITRKP